LIWFAYEQMHRNPSVAMDVEHIQSLISSLNSVAAGDRGEALRLDPLFERVAVLAEQEDRD
jgi:hypothetical protein